MYRRCVIKSLPTPLRLSPFYLTMFKGKMITRRTYDRLMTSSLLKSRRLYSSTVSQEPESLVGASNHVELVLPGLAIETPMVTKNELVKYFYPLFCRGWDIKCLSKADFEHFGDGNRLPQADQSPFLVHKFRFKGSKSARTFLKEIFSIESAERHHVSFNLWSEKRPVITVMIQTHAAIRLDENDRATTDVIEPGLTLRDIRFAVLLENLLDNLIARVPDPIDTDRDVAWKELLLKYPFRALEPTQSNSDNSNNSNNSNKSNSSNSSNSSGGSDILQTLSMLARQ